MPKLHSIIERVRRNEAHEEDWLYIAGAARDLTLETEADLGRPDFDDNSPEEIPPAGFAERGLSSTIDLETVRTCINWADQLSGSQDNAAALDIIRYYIRFDAWPQTLNAPDPPSPEESFRLFARGFCDKLGPENAAKECRREGCHRGVVKFSVFCRRHHFEKVYNRPYPFED